MQWYSNVDVHNRKKWLIHENKHTNTHTHIILKHPFHSLFPSHLPHTLHALILTHGHHPSLRGDDFNKVWPASNFAFQFSPPKNGGPCTFSTIVAQHLQTVCDTFLTHSRTTRARLSPLLRKHFLWSHSLDAPCTIYSQFISLHSSSCHFGNEEPKPACNLSSQVTIMVAISLRGT